MENELLCNFKKCRKPLTSQAWVTSCSHIFCNEDGTREFGKAFVCPACETSLPDKYDAVRVDLNPSEQYKSMILAGQKPEVILDICARAFTFWTYQVHQEIVYQEYMSIKAKQKQSELEKYYENVLQKAKNELDQVKQQLESTKRELEAAQARAVELREKLTERNRQYQKLLSLYSALRRKFVSPAYFERQAGEKEKHDRGNVMGITSANEVLFRPNQSRSTDGEDMSETERNFILRPVPTPTPRQTAQTSPFDFLSNVAPLLRRKFQQ